MTLLFQPSVDAVRQLDIGKHVRLEILSLAFDDQAHAVGVRTLSGDTGHITLATRPGVPASHANTLCYVPLEDARRITLDGILGVQCAVGTESVPADDMARARRLVGGALGAKERFAGLSASQRRALHTFAEQVGLASHSEGRKKSDERTLYLTVVRKMGELPVAREGRVQTIKTAKDFAALFGPPRTVLHARMTPSGLKWIAPPAILEVARDARVVVLMRGFPGSGKSGVANALHAAWASVGSVICSADRFWDGEETSLSCAHDACRALFRQHLEQQTPLIIVDNTNVQKSHYGFYLEQAEQYTYEWIMLEMVCQSTKELEFFRARSSPIVPGAVVGNMWQRWEANPAALRVAPYMGEANEEVELATPSEDIPDEVELGEAHEDIPGEVELATPNEDIPGEVDSELWAWLTRHQLASHPPTHIVMDHRATHRASRFGIPPQLRTEFHRLYLREWDQHFLNEVVYHPLPVQLFFDVDYI